MFTMTDRSPLPWLATTVALALLIACGGKTDPMQRPSTVTSKAERLIKAGNYYEAIRVWQTAPPGADTEERVRETEKILAEEVSRRIKRAGSLQRRGRIGEALQQTSEAYKLDPRKTELVPRMDSLRKDLEKRRAELLPQAEAKLAAKDLEGAHELLLRLNYLDPFDSQTKKRLDETEKQWNREVAASFERGMDFYAKRDFAEAAKEFEKVLQRWPGNTLARNYHQQSRTDAGPVQSDREKAERTERQRVAQATQTLVARAEACTKSGDFRCALERLNEALDEDPDSVKAGRLRHEIVEKLTPQLEEIYRRGLDHYRREDHEQAISEWRLVILVDPTHERARKYIERAELILRRLERVPGAKAPEGG